jgi:hypothetical protein
MSHIEYLISRANIDEINEQILPFDDVLVTDLQCQSKRTETIMRYGAVTDEMIITQQYGIEIDSDAYSDDATSDSLDEMRWLKPDGQRKTSQVFYGTTTTIFLGGY